MLFLPLAAIFFIALFFLLALVFALVQVGVISHVFERIGIAPEYMFLFLLGSLLGSFINIPVKRFVEEKVAEGGVVDFFGFRHVIPRTRYKQEGLLAVNVGGAVVPLILSTHIVVAQGWIGAILIATAVVALAVNRLAWPSRIPMEPS